MNSVIGLNILAVLCAYLSKYKDFKIGLKTSFFLIFIFLAIRFDFGNDYMNYYRDFSTLNSYSSIDYFDKSLHYDPGWILLCKLFKPFGFFVLVIFLALFNCIVYYFFIKKYVPRDLYWLAIFIYVFTPGFMLVHASAMRQSIAIGLFLTAIPYIYKKDPIKYFLFIGIAYFFHASAIVLLPLYLIAFSNWKITNKSGAVFVIIFLSLFVFGSSILPSINVLLNTYFQKYETYAGTGTEVGSGVGIFFLSIILIFVLYYSKTQKADLKTIFILAIFSFMFIPIGLLITMVSRVGMYFTPATIIAYPIIFKNIREPLVKRLFLFFLMFFTLYTFIVFFNSEIYKKGYDTYKTIFTAPS